MPDLVVTTQQLEYLVAIDRSPTWRHAAESVGVSTSALSQGVRELERRLGVALFERDGRQRTPTRDHAEVLRYARDTLAATHDLAQWLAGRRAGGAGSLRVGMIDAAATHHFRDVLRRFRVERPDVGLHLAVAASGPLLRDLARAELDLVVCVQPTETPVGVTTVHLLDDPLAVVAPPAPLGPDGTTPPAAWGPWVSFPAGAHTRAGIEAALAARGARFDVVAESHQPEVLREMVLLGIGWSVLPVGGLGPLDRGGLQVVDPALTHRRLVLARRANAAPHPLADALTAELVAAARH